VPTAGTQAGLQRMIDGVRARLLLIDIEEVSIRAWHAVTGGTVNTIDGIRNASQIRGRNLRLSGLVDVQELEQLCSFGSDIANLQHRLTPYLLLEVEVE